jgi:hypothetical protein
MTQQPIYKIAALIILIAVVALAAIGFIQSRSQSETGISDGNTTPVLVTPTTPISREGTLEGTIVCLPHRDTSGPQTMECAFGLQIGVMGATNAPGAATFYALDTQDVQSENSILQQTGIMVKVTGTIVPVEALSSDMWQKYNIKGIMRVKTYEKVASGPAPVLVNSKVTLGLNELITVNGTTISVWAVTEDSRCPSDVMCIQAGRVVVALAVTSPSGSSRTELTLGKTTTTETLSITLDDVKPYPVSTHKVTDSEYRFAFTVKNK